MIAYFKLQNNLCMLAGAVIGFVLAVLNYDSISQRGGYAAVFFIALFVMIGIIIGRVVSSRLANRRVRKLTSLLYQEGKPQEFLDKFKPIADKIPNNVVEYVDARVKMAYAYEGLGEFEKGLQIVEALEPEKLKLHMLAGTSLTENQKMRLYLLTEDLEQSEHQLERLKELQQEAEGRANTLARNLAECVKLAENWLNFLRGESYDSAYIQEEIQLAGNRIHKSEMQILLARMRRSEGQEEAAKQLLKEAAESGEGLYGGRRARQLAEEWKGTAAEIFTAEFCNDPF